MSKSVSHVEPSVDRSHRPVNVSPSSKVPMKRWKNSGPAWPVIVHVSPSTLISYTRWTPRTSA